jgi:glucuronate isomerase
LGVEERLTAAGWHAQIDRLSHAAGIDAGSYESYIAALEQRRAAFKELGALATDHGAAIPYTERLMAREADAIFERALRGEAIEDDSRRFTAHMPIEFARMIAEDGLVMQLHAGALRDHHQRCTIALGRTSPQIFPSRPSGRAICARC